MDGHTGRSPRSATSAAAVRRTTRPPKPKPSPWALDGTATKSVRRARALIDSTPIDTDALEHWEIAALRSELIWLRDAVGAMLTQTEPQAL